MFHITEQAHSPTPGSQGRKTGDSESITVHRRTEDVHQLPGQGERHFFKWHVKSFVILANSIQYNLFNLDTLGTSNEVFLISEVVIYVQTLPEDICPN